MIQTETLELLEWSRLCQHLATFTATKLGAIAAQHLPIPKSQVESEILLAQTQEADVLDQQVSGGLKFEGIHDVGEALERANRGGTLAGEDLLAIATTLSGARTLRRIVDAQEDAVPQLFDLISELRTHPELEKHIHYCIDDRGKVTDRASPVLTGVREQMKSLRDRVYGQLQRLIQRHANAMQEPVITQRDNRYVVPVKASHKDLVPGIVLDASGTGSTLYIEPKSVSESNNRLRQLVRKEEREEEAVRQRLTTQVAEVKDDLERLLIIVTQLDLASARARYSVWLGGHPPRFIQSQEVVRLRRLQHPLLLWQAKHEQGHPVVPVDVTIQPEIRVVAITGPNTGGKTVTLKTLGLAVLMAKVGLYLPAQDPVELPWFSKILADIGDEQSLQQSLSTFSGHIRRISRILDALETNQKRRPASSPHADSAPAEAESEPGNFSDPDKSCDPAAASVTDTSDETALSLVLLDEVGAGTDPSEGSALAIALLCYLADHARLTVATTHFGELKALKYEDQRFENASVEFDDVKLMPTYKLLWGIPGRSNALSIARRLGLNKAIIEAAQTQVSPGASQEMNRVIEGLESQRRRQQSQADKAANVLRQAENLQAEVAAKAANLKEREDALKLAQEHAVQDAIAQAKQEIAQVIRQLQRGKATAQDAQKATEKLDKLTERHLPSRQQPPPKPQPGFQPKESDRVRLVKLGGQVAEVLSDPDENGELMVRFGMMKVTVNVADIESLAGEKVDAPQPPPKAKPAAEPQQSKTLSVPMVRTERNTVDLRGSRVADAEVVIEEAIRRANGVLWIIHGHGTGKLKRGVHEFLKRHPQVSRFEAAAQADGGSGATVVYIK